MFVGTHDFRSFTATDPDLATRNSKFEDQSSGAVQTEARTRDPNHLFLFVDE